MCQSLTVRGLLAAVICMSLSPLAFGQNADSITALPPEGATAAPPIGLPTGYFEQDGRVRAGFIAPGFNDWASAGGGTDIIDSLVPVPNELFPALTVANPHICFISDDFNAILCRDPNWGNAANPATGIGADFTQFSGMSNKNDDDIDPGAAPWEWGGGNSGGPQKNDLTNTYLATVIDDCDNLWLFFAAETRSIDGDSHVDFEVNQAGITVTGDTGGQLYGNGPLGGRTIGDFIVSVDFEQGGVQPVLSFRTWDGAMYNLVDPPLYSSCGIDAGTNGSPNVYARTVTEDEAEADGGLGGGPWGHFNKNGSDLTNPRPLQLVEGAVNLTALNLPIDVCSNVATVMFKSRSSASFTAELKDFSLVRYPLLPTPECEITGDEEKLACPGATGLRYSVTETTGLDVSYEWTIMGDASFADGTDTTSSTVNVDVGAVCDSSFELWCTVTTDFGCYSECHLSVAIDDDIDPMISCPEDDDIAGCDEDDLPDPYQTLAEFIEAGGSASDNCDNDLDFFYDGQVWDGQTCPATYTRTYRVKDDCGNEDTCTQTLTVDDDEDPVISCPPTLDVTGCDLSDLPPAYATLADFIAAGGSASDDCDELVLTHSDSAPSGTCPIMVTRTYRVTDDCGNYAECTQLIKIDDDEDPVISCPPMETVEGCDLSDLPPAYTTVEDFIAAGGSASDNCDTDLALTHSDSAPSGTCPIMVTRTYRVTDDCGNYKECTQLLKIDDTTKPTIHCPRDDQVDCFVAHPFTVTGMDACDDSLTFDCEITGGTNLDNVTLTALGGGDFEVTFTGTATATITCTATDDCGNTSDSCSFTLSAACGAEACSPGYWRQPQHFDSWCETPYQPMDNFCGAGPATLFVDAFDIVDTSGAPAAFNPSMLLIGGLRTNSGAYNQALFHGTAALLNASHPGVGFGASAGEVKAVMQDAFSGNISFSEAHGIFAGWNAVESQGGCPLN